MVRSIASLEKLARFGQRARFFAARGPAYFYAYGRWRLGRWLALRLSREFETEGALLGGLDLSPPALAEARVCAAGHAPRHVAGYFRARARPAFCFEPADRAALGRLIPPAQRAATIGAADEICRNSFRFRGVEPVTFEGPIDWTYQPGGNLDWTWDLNRHEYFMGLGRAYWYTGDERYAAKFRELLLDWLARNPAGAEQPGWQSVFEVAFRINTWVWAFYAFRGARCFDDQVCLALLEGLLAHGRFLDTNLELHVPNNHLLLEAKALALLGLLFPEFRAAGRWRRRGMRILAREARAQVCADGVHGERATLYHRIIAGELLELLVLLENNGVPIPGALAEAFGRMVEFELWAARPDGQLPLFGDSALADTHLRFSAAAGGPALLRRPDLLALAPPLDEGTAWLLGPERIGQAGPGRAGPGPSSRAFPRGGYFVMRAGEGQAAAYLAFDCGPFGYGPMPNHGHADALSFELYACGGPLLLDPGVYSTALGLEWRNFFRGSRAHNTVVVDDCDQTLLLDARRSGRPARATLRQWLSNEHFDFADGSHDGYRRLAAPITHRRQIFFAKPEYWVVIDLLTGRGEHCFDLYFHLAPGADTRLDPGTLALRAGYGAGPALTIAPLEPRGWQAELVAGATAPIQGWVSPRSGEKQPAPALRYRQQGPAPALFCTVLYPHRAGDERAPAIVPLAVEVAGEARRRAQITALCIDGGTWVDYLLVDRGPAGGRKRFAGYETDAPLAYARHRKADGARVSALADGGRLLFQGEPCA